MAVILETHADEQSTYVVTAAFTDEDDEDVEPDSIKWSLTDGDGNIVNNRRDVSETPATCIDIVLKGSDLLLSGTDDGLRELVVEATYSGDLGDDLPLKGSCRFVVDNMPVLPSASMSSSSSSSSSSGA